jgi:hypothetical protein
VLFAGSNHPPNKEAVQFIIKHVAPKLPQYDFVIMGSVCDRLSKKGNMLITGPVSKTGKNKWFNRADMFINPVVKGSGSNLKMLEYMYFDKPIVATPTGARGMFSTKVNICPRKSFVKAISDMMGHKTRYHTDALTYEHIVSLVLPFYAEQH